MKTLSEIQNKMKKSISLKIAAIGFLSLLMLIPMGMIQDLILERQFTRDEVVREISDKWGKSQEFTGPILTIPWFETLKNEDKIHKIYNQLYVLPENLSINGEITPEIRYRGIYKVVVYGSDLKIAGDFLIPDFEALKIQPENILWEDAFVSIGLTDMRGIQNEMIIDWEGDLIKVEPGTRHKFLGSGISAVIPLNGDSDLVAFDLQLILNGSQNLYFTPVGKTTKVSLASNWNNPSFSGSYLPDFEEISETGFIADWQVLHLNRNYPQVWKGDNYSVQSSRFGIELLMPVDEYQKSLRSTKYAFMFISLTFIIFLFIEIINKKRIHPVQYLLVSGGLLIFYTLLLSLSEQLGFNMAYLISGVAISGLITYYMYITFKSIKLTMITGAVIALLYTFLFVILQLQDYSLLLGSIGLFLVLALIMYLSRKIDWYQEEGHTKIVQPKSSI